LEHALSLDYFSGVLLKSQCAVSDGMASQLLIPLHVKYITVLASHTSSLTYHLTTHLRLNAIYWAVTTLFLFRQPDALPRDEIIAYVLDCWDDKQGAFGSHPGHDAHIHVTLSAIQILFMYDRLDCLQDRRERIIQCECRADFLFVSQPKLLIACFLSDILFLQDPTTGAFAGDSSHLEYDTRFLYCAIQCLSLLSSTSTSSNLTDPLQQDPLCRLDVEKTISAILACHNFDGGFGTDQGAESHASQAFVSIGALRILNAIDRLGDHGRRRHEIWLSERQLPNGGLNGRPQKLEDVSP
jgi:geranylgeranyl transferase type-2 subunit beta